MRIGFSTGALALGDVSRALVLLDGRGTTAIEISALRCRELDPILKVLTSLVLDDFEYVALHAPSRFDELSEDDVARRLLDLVADIVVVVHPDTLQDADLWRPFGARLAIENMDKRKSTGRTARELRPYFDSLPDARLCLDVAHARQVDPTLSQLWMLIDTFRDRLAHIHISGMDNAGGHRALTPMAVHSFQRIARFIPAGTPIIVESVVPESCIDDELSAAIRAMTPPTRRAPGGALAPTP